MGPIPLANKNWSIGLPNRLFPRRLGRLNNFRMVIIEIYFSSIKILRIVKN